MIEPAWRIELDETELMGLLTVGYWRSSEQPLLPAPGTQIDAAWDAAER